MPPFQRREVAPFESRGGNGAWWINARVSELIAQLRQQGFTWGWAASLSIPLIAQAWRETGKGTKEWNYNLANEKPSNAHVADDHLGWHGAYIYRTGNDGKSWYRAYDSLADGVADFLWLVQLQRYQPAWRYLLETGDGRGWYERLMNAGYNPRFPGDLDEYDGIIRKLGGYRTDLRTHDAW